MKVVVRSKYNAQGQLYYDPPRCYWCGKQSNTASQSIVQPNLHASCGDCNEQERDACEIEGKATVRIGRKLVILNRR